MVYPGMVGRLCTLWYTLGGVYREKPLRKEASLLPWVMRDMHNEARATHRQPVGRHPEVPSSRETGRPPLVRD